MRLCVLLVEPNGADARATIACLEQAGFALDVDVATTLAEVETHVRRRAHDIALSGFDFGTWTGLDALARARALGWSAPMIIVTGALGDERAAECVRRGAADYVLKSNLQRLPFAVRHVLELHAAQSDAEARFRKLVDATFDGVAVTREGVIREVNRGFVELFGYESAAEVIGLSVGAFAAPESREMLVQRVAQGIEGTYEFTGICKDGTKLTVEATAKAHTVDGRPGRITALRNIGAQRELEAQFRQAQKMEAIGRLAGGVAHDFNNLLTVIGSYAEMVHRDLSPSDPRREDIEQITKAADAAATLTRQLLAFSRQQVIQPRVVALDAIVASTEKMLKRVIGEDIRLTTRLSASSLTIRIDPGQLEHVLMNLAVNARDAMPKGGQITIETAERVFDADAARAHWPATPGHYAMLAMSDTGVGMTDDVRARIFEPFYTTKELGKGTGLGLATVYGVVKQNNGFVWVYSEPGRGSTFKIYLPLLSGAELDSAADNGSTAELPRGSETILLAEDAPAVRSAVRATLERLGYTVLEAPTGRDALAIAAKHAAPVHLLLTDVVMPQMDGRQLAEQFATIRPEARVLYMSGYTDDAVVLHGVLTEDVAYLQKPFTSEALAHKLRDVLDGSAPARRSDPGRAAT